MHRPRAQQRGRYRGSVKTLSAISRVNLLRELQLHGPQTIAELATATGLHHNTAREHLHLLIDAGFVQARPEPVGGRGRPRMRYCTATSTAPAANESVADPEQQLQQQLEMLQDHTRQCGFATTIVPEQARLTLHDCPFSELAREHPQVCEAHHDLLRDALARTDGPLDAPRLHPFSGDNECTVDFAPHGR